MHFELLERDLSVLGANGAYVPIEREFQAALQDVDVFDVVFVPVGTGLGGGSAGGNQM